MHFRCYHCGFDNYGAHYLRCPECGRRARQVDVPRIRLLLLATAIAATLLFTWLTFLMLWQRSDYVQVRPRLIAGAPAPPSVLRGICMEECVIRAGILGLIGLGVCLVYAYWVFEEGTARRLLARYIRDRRR